MYFVILSFVSKEWKDQKLKYCLWFVSDKWLNPKSTEQRSSRKRISVEHDHGVSVNLKWAKEWTSKIRMKILMAKAVGGSLEVNLPETSKTMVPYVSIQMLV